MEDSDEELIVIDTLFVGLTRPATALGVPYSAVVIEIMIVGCIFLAMGNPLYLAFAIPTHIVLYLICAEDPRAFDSIFMWAKTAGQCQNRGFWGAATFSPSTTKKWFAS